MQHPDERFAASLPQSLTTRRATEADCTRRVGDEKPTAELRRPQPSTPQAGRMCWTTSKRRQASQGRPQPAARGQQGRLRLALLAGFASRTTSARRPRCRSSSACTKPPGSDDSGSKQTRSSFEPIEIRGVVEYLLDKSQPFEYVEPTPRRRPSSRRPSAASGCSRPAAAWPAISTSDFPAGQDEPRARPVAHRRQAGRTANRTAPSWLYSWLRNPNRYHPRTVMPNVFLDPIEGRSDGNVTDPAADIAAFLLALEQGLEADGRSQPRARTTKQKTLDDLALEHLQGGVHRRARPKQYLQERHSRGSRAASSRATRSSCSATT